MAAIGFRCWKDRVALVVVNGTRSAPELVTHEVRTVPALPSRAEELHWVRREVQEILDTHRPDRGFYKAAEPMAQRKDLARAEVEGVLQEAAFGHKTRLSLTKRINVQIVRDTAFSRKPRYLQELLSGTPLAGLPAAQREAGMAALCGLPE